MVPGVDFEKPELDADYLNTLLVAVQKGELTLAVHYREQTEASVVRLHPIATAEANALTASDNKFSSKILVDGASDKPAIQMLMNTEHLAKNYRHVSADTLINALAFPVENVKGGFIIAKPFRAIARPIAGWLLNIIFDQGEKLHRRFIGNRGEDRPAKDVRLLSGEDAGEGLFSMFEIGVMIVRWVSDDPQPGIVECELTDRFGKVWRFIEKSAVVSSENLSSESRYPRPGVIPCQVIGRSRDESGREVAEIATESPWGVEAFDGTTRFHVFADELVQPAGR
jgi:hypothetical protein